VQQKSFKKSLVTFIREKMLGPDLGAWDEFFINQLKTMLIKSRK
jgi:hypothetical protein